MTERYVIASPWRIGVAVVALLALPPMMALTMAVYAGGLLAGIYGLFGSGGMPVVVCGLILMVIAFLLTQLCMWARRGRKLMVRRARFLLGLATSVGLAPVIGGYLAGPWAGFPKAYGSVTAVYFLLGIWLAVDAWEDPWSI